MKQDEINKIRSIVITIIRLLESIKKIIDGNKSK